MAPIPTQMVRVRGEIYKDLRELAEREDVTMQEVLARAIDMYRRHRFWQQTHDAYAVLRADPEAWQQELEERALWDHALNDELGADEYEDERLSEPTMRTASQSSS